MEDNHNKKSRVISIFFGLYKHIIVIYNKVIKGLEKIMFLKFLGNGSGFCVDKGNNCAYFKEDDKILFLDFGDSTFERVISPTR